MYSTEQIEEKRTFLKSIVDEANELNKKTVDEKRDFTEEEKKIWNKLNNNMDDVEKSIEQMVKANERSNRVRLMNESLDGLDNKMEKENKRLDPPSKKGKARIEILEKSPFKRSGDYLDAVFRAASPNMAGSSIVESLYNYDKELRAATGMSEGTPSDGGFLVSPDLSNELLQNVIETGLLIPRLTRIPLSATSNGVKIPGIDETSRADGSRQGGVRAYWTGEAAQMTSTKPKFREIDLRLSKLTALCYVTDELLQDTTALGAWIPIAFGREINFKLDDAIINGTGAGMLLGILKANALISIAKETNQAANTIVKGNVDKMYARCVASSLNKAVWIINQDCLPQLLNLSMPVGTGGAPAWLNAGSIAGVPYSTLYGKEVIMIEQCQTVGTVGDIMLVDFSQYYYIDKGGIESAVSIHVKFDYAETAFRFIYRADGQPAWSSALTPKNGANTVSPFIALASRD